MSNVAPIGASRQQAGRLLQRNLTNAYLALLQGSQSHTFPPALAVAAAAPRPSCRLLHPPRLQARRNFSTTASLARRRIRFRDNNPDRGVSSLRRSGPREFLSVSDDPLPEPRKLDLAREARKQTDPNHGLWEFFYDKRLANTPAELSQHGRAWTVEELRQKSWEDLHKLWWICCKERNRIHTTINMISQKALGFGRNEADDRDREVRTTMRAIKHVLTERWYTWEDAVELAKADPEIDMSGKGDAYTPQDYLEVDPAVAVKSGEKTK